MSVDTTAPAKVSIASNEMRYTLVPRLSYLLSVKDWSRLLQVSNILRQILDDHTTVQYTLNGRQIALYRWGTVDGNVPRLYISLPNLNVSRSYGWKGGTTGETFWHKIRYIMLLCFEVLAYWVNLVQTITTDLDLLDLCFLLLSFSLCMLHDFT